MLTAPTLTIVHSRFVVDSSSFLAVWLAHNTRVHPQYVNIC